jgi:hypothetical protein
MKKKNGVNRRQFLASTSAVALGVAVLQGKELSGETAPPTFPSGAGSSIPYSRQAGRGRRDHLGRSWSAGTASLRCGGWG